MTTRPRISHLVATRVIPGMLAGVVLIGIGAYLLATQHFSTTQEAAAAPGGQFVVADQDLMLYNEMGGSLVKKGQSYPTSIYTKVLSVTYKVAPEDLLVGKAGSPLTLVPKGGTYMDYAAIYVEPASRQPAAMTTATQDTVVVGKNEFSLAHTGDAIPTGPYAKTRSATFKTAQQDLQVRLADKVQIVQKGQQYLDDAAAFVEPAPIIQANAQPTQPGKPTGTVVSVPPISVPSKP